MFCSKLQIISEGITAWQQSANFKRNSRLKKQGVNKVSSEEKNLEQEQVVIS